MLLQSVPQATVLSAHVPPFMHGCGLHPSLVVQVAPVNPSGQEIVVVVDVDVEVDVDVGVLIDA